jgi:hypothetical protein|tara:strand:+ start:206 stop:448 length:243 start_codon:yes stop_codon:yes gene_type:complete
MMREQKGLGLQVVEDNVEIPKPNFRQHLQEAIHQSKLVNNCSCCGLWVNHKQLKSKSDQDEHEISGMCKPCMDKIFGEDE